MCSHFLFVFDYIAWIYILFSFTNEKGEFTILTTKHSFFVSYITQKVHLIYGHNKHGKLEIKKTFTDHQSELQNILSWQYMFH